MGEALSQEKSQDYRFVRRKDKVEEYSPAMNENENYSTSSDDDDDHDVSSSDTDKGLFDLSELMEQLPIKRGLSQHYQGKSESFKNLSKATSVEDLSKKAVYRTSNKKKIKGIKFRRNSHNDKFILPKGVIKKKNPAGNLFSASSFCRRRTGFSSTMQQHFG